MGKALEKPIKMGSYCEEYIAMYTFGDLRWELINNIVMVLKFNLYKVWLTKDIFIGTYQNDRYKIVWLRGQLGQSMGFDRCIRNTETMKVSSSLQIT